MGCSYETAKQKIGINEATTASATTSAITVRTRNCNPKPGKVQHSTKFNQQYPLKDITNNDCQQLLQQQQQKLLTNKANKTLTATVSKIFNDDSQNKKREELKKKTNFYSLEAKEYINRHTLSPYAASSFSDTINLELAENEKDEVLQESCINCYPLACHNRVCCKKQLQQQLHLATGEISTHTFNPPNYSNASNNKRSCSNNNNNCRCHLSFFYPKHTQNTLRNEQQCEPNLCHCNCVATQPNNFATFANNCTASGHCLQRTLAHARASLASNALDLKNNLVEVVGNCATIVESLIGNTNAQYIRDCLNESNSNSNNHNKSEPYRGYCQRKQQQQHHPLLHEPNYITCTSSISNLSSTTSSNSCSLHDAISSNSRCNINNSSNINCRSSSGCNKRNNSNNRSCDNNYNCQASSAHTAAFNYISHNYYQFIRNTINFYTASSVILVLCYLTTTTSAATTKSDTTSMDKHPM